MELVANVRLEYTLDPADGRAKQKSGRRVSLAFVRSSSGGWSLELDLKPRKVLLRVKTPAWLFGKNVESGMLTLKLGDATCPALGVRRGTVQVMLSGGSAAELAPLHDRIAHALSGGKFRPALQDCTNSAAGTAHRNATTIPAMGLLGAKRPASTAISTAAPVGGGVKASKTAAAGAYPLSDEQEVALQYIMQGKSLFLTGPAGTGKSLLLRRILHELPSHSTFFTASTGLAACQLGGTTLHSFAGIGRGDAPFDVLVRKANRPETRRKWLACKVLIIDEISMVDGATFDLLEKIARAVRGVSLPFGNIQLVLVGDFHQLPPVQKARKFCFESEAWKACIHKSLELTCVHRQSDTTFVRWLGKIRKGVASRGEINELLDRCSGELDTSDGIVATKLQTHRADCEEQNQRELERLPGESVSYLAMDDGLGNMMDQLSGSCPAKSRLDLKVGAQVMLIQTINASSQLVNGARGVVRGFRGAQKMPVVKFSNGVEVMVGREKWSLAIGNAQATRKQVPLALAWAVSVHRSQGMTLDKVEVSLAKAFEYGMAYVALSRVHGLEGLRIEGGIAPLSLEADPKVLQFYREMCG
mmetsp:Transcript_45478/g.116363  ORF Transcript_45478/g.116363 Transcript_45478/m.116363 type:complete len:587 (-) Transcript_45478:404-2164(-)